MAIASIAWSSSDRRGWSPGMIAVTGSPSPRTRATRSRRSHFEIRRGSVEMMISSNAPVATASWTATNGSGPPASPPTGRPAALASSRRALSSVQSASRRSSTSGTSSVKRHGAVAARRSTASSRRCAAAVRFATTSTRVGPEDWRPAMRATVSPARPPVKASADRAGRRERDHHHAEDDPVADEHGDRVAREVAQQQRDRRVADDEGDQRRDHGRADRQASLAGVAQLEQARQHDGRDRQQERVARGRGAVEVAEEPGRDRRARAAHAGDERERLGEADHEAVARVDLAQRAVATADRLGGEHHESEDDQRRPDQLEVAELVLDRVLERQPEDADRDRAEEDVPAHPGVEVAADRGIAQRPQPRDRDPPEVGAEVQQHRGHRPELDDGGEGGAGVAPAEDRRDDAEVAAARDRQELGEALDEAEDDRVERTHAAADGSARGLWRA